MKVFDLHCDTLCTCEEKQAVLRKNELQLDLERGPRQDGWVQTFAVWVPDQYRGEAAWEYTEKHHSRFLEELKQNEDWMYRYFGQEPEPGKCGSLFAIEGGAAIGGNLDRLDTLQDWGTAFITLTWNGDNELASGVGGSGGGLTPLGRQAVKEMERLSIIPDVSHLNEKGFWQVEELCQKPFIATHSNARSVFDHPRNLKDDQIRAIIARKGLIGLNFFPMFVAEGEDYKPEQLIRHAEHILNLGGESVLALGSDFDGASMPSFIYDVKGLANLYESMVKYFHEPLANQIFFGNAHRFFKENLSSRFSCCQ
ncbi:MAG: dipeptidase [Massiliimalia sp.]